ncbi:MAG: hypothetical protein J6Q03_10885 [Paludibacteraceae bacterium]|nr:hypothetical protein [Paludibacteraceae bacterium]
MLTRKAIILLSFWGMLGFGLQAQNNTSSPYTRYGYGELVDLGFGQSRAMGGVSSALRSKKHINPANPASYTAIDSMSFRFEFGASLRISAYSDSNADQRKWNGNLEYLALQFPVTRWLGVSAGLVPYSFVGYDFEMKQAVPSSIVGGSLESTSFYKGTGGLNQVFVGVGVSPFRNFSVGANLFYNFGTIEHTSTVSFKNTAFKSTEQIKRIEVTDFNTSFGAQYEINFSKERSLALGAVMSLKSELGADAVQTVTTASVDTVSLSFDNKFDLPLCFGMGFVYNLNERLHVGFDYKRQIWSDVRYFGEKEFTDKDKYALGVELLPDGNSKRYLKRVAYRAGFNVSNSYYDVNGNDFKEYVASVGFGLPLKRGLNPTVVNLGFEYGNIGKKSENMIKEQYFKFILNMTINERWFTKRKFE